MVNVKFAANNRVIGIDDLHMGSFEKNAMLGQLNQAKNLKQAERTINQYLCYPSAPQIKAFIVWNNTQVLKSVSKQYQWVGDWQTGYALQ